MADALCGPSNALQNFQKHSSVDRTLQQDRLISRQRSTQGFRSNQGLNAGLLDPEFEAFQAGHLASPQPPQLDSRPFAPSHFVQPPQAQPSLPDWANDFQKLHIRPGPSLHAPAPAVQRAQAAPQSSWHQDFLASQQQTSMASFHQPRAMFQPSFQNMNTWQQPSHFDSISQDKGKQAVQQDSSWNSEAFAAAFEAADLDAIQVDPTNYEDDGLSMSKLEQEIAREIEMESEATALYVQQANALNQDYDDGLSQEKLEEEIAREIEMETEEIQYLISKKTEELEREAQTRRDETNHLQGLDLSRDMLDVDEEFATAEEHQPPEEIYADDPHPFMDIGIREPVHELSREEQQQSRASTPKSIDEDLARTAGALLESVSHDTSEKFQGSVFLQLMRRLRDREVTVEGENFVETGELGLRGPTLAVENQEAISRIPAEEQDLDLGRFGEESGEDVSKAPAIEDWPEFDPPAPPFEDWRNRLWSGMAPGSRGMVAT